MCDLFGEFAVEVRLGESEIRAWIKNIDALRDLRIRLKNKLDEIQSSKLAKQQKLKDMDGWLWG